MEDVTIETAETAETKVLVSPETLKLCYQLLMQVTVTPKSPSFMQEAQAIDIAKKEIESVLK